MEFFARDVTREAAITHRQLDFYLRSGAIRPSRGGGRGSGSHRRFDWRDLLTLILVGEVLRAGLRVQAVAPALRLVQRGRCLPPLGRLRGIAVLTDGRRAVLVRRGRLLAKARRSAGVSYLLDVGAAAERVRQRIEALGRSAT
jgi:DNA-binding transcriptional MerR regulator